MADKKKRTPKRFLSGILRDLRIACLLHAKKGKSGGFMLARGILNFGEILRFRGQPKAKSVMADRERAMHLV